MDVTEVPEVLEFMNAQENMEAFMARNEAVMREFRLVAEQYNTARQAAEQKVRGLDVSCGPFVQFQRAIKYDAEKLYNSVGRTEFLKMGGTIKTVASYDIEKKTIEAVIARNELPPEVVAVVKKEEPRYKTPDELVIP